MKLALDIALGEDSFDTDIFRSKVAELESNLGVELICQSQIVGGLTLRTGKELVQHGTWAWHMR